MIDERAAWDLVRTVTPMSGAAPMRVHRSSPESEWLEVDRSGSWEASHPVTDAARDLIDLFLPLQLVPTIVIGQLGQSLDGRIATDSGSSHFVTGPQDIERLHRLRALVDAVIVGRNTVEMDDPHLTVRKAEGDNPVRVVLDPEARLDPSRHVFTDGAARSLVVRLARADTDSVAVQGDEVFVGPAEAGGLDVVVLLQLLRGEGLNRILVEGGGLTVSRFLAAGALDRLHITVAPLLIGSGCPSLTLPPIATLDEAIRPRHRRFQLGQDVLFDLDLR